MGSRRGQSAGAEPENAGELPPKESWVTPLLPSSGHLAAPGILDALGGSTENLKLIQWE